MLVAGAAVLGASRTLRTLAVDPPSSVSVLEGTRDGKPSVVYAVADSRGTLRVTTVR